MAQQDMHIHPSKQRLSVCLSWHRHTLAVCGPATKTSTEDLKNHILEKKKKEAEGCVVSEGESSQRTWDAHTTVMCLRTKVFHLGHPWPLGG